MLNDDSDLAKTMMPFGLRKILDSNWSTRPNVSTYRNMVYKRILKVLFAQIQHMGHFWAEIRTLKFLTRNYVCEKSSKIQKMRETFFELNQPFLTILRWKKLENMSFGYFPRNIGGSKFRPPKFEEKKLRMFLTSPINI